jgi:MerR family transcriptional regulator, copper efflux regulator
MRIGELSRLTDTPVRTIRYYEEIGLLPPADRSESGYRLFEDDHLRHLRFIRRARRLGLRLDQAREILQAASSGSPPCNCVRDAVQRSIERIDERIPELQAMRSDLVRSLEIADRTAVSARRGVDEICPAIESVPVAGSHPSLDSPVDWRV